MFVSLVALVFVGVGIDSTYGSHNEDRFCSSLSNPDVCIDNHKADDADDCLDYCEEIDLSHSQTYTVEGKDMSNYYSSNSCLYETSDFVYDIFQLKKTQGAWTYWYLSHTSDSSEYMKSEIDLYLNVCDSPDLSEDWDFDVISEYVTDSVVTCTYDQEEYMTCAQFGHIQYSAEDFSSIDGSQVTIHLGQVTCYNYRRSTDTVYPHSNDVYLLLECPDDSNSETQTKISGVEGPLMAYNGTCDKDGEITITMSSPYACGRAKIYPNNSYIACPSTYNISTNTINCAIHSYSNIPVISDEGLFVPTGTADELTYENIAIYVRMQPSSDDESLRSSAESDSDVTHIEVKYNVSNSDVGTYIVQIDLNQTKEEMLLQNNGSEIKLGDIQIWCNTSYITGPNDIIGNTYYTVAYFNGNNKKNTDDTTRTLMSYSWAMAVALFAIILVINFLFRMKDHRSREYARILLTCQCMSVPWKLHMDGCFICCCGCLSNASYTGRSGSYFISKNGTKKYIPRMHELYDSPNSPKSRRHIASKKDLTREERLALKKSGKVKSKYNDSLTFSSPQSLGNHSTSYPMSEGSSLPSEKHYYQDYVMGGIRGSAASTASTEEYLL